VLPVILVVVPDDAACQEMIAELGRYARDYRLVGAGTGEEALAAVASLEAAGVPVAMVVAHAVLEPRGGLDLLARARSVVPTAKRVVLLDWGLDREQATAMARAAALGLVDTVLTRPTGRRDEDFHAAVTTDLADWAWTAQPVVEAVRVVAEPADARALTICEVLERLGIPTGRHEPTSDVGIEILAHAGPGAALPLVEVMRSSVLADPSNRDIAVAFGAAAEVEGRVFDLAVVGAGPAGLGAAVYGASEGLATLVLEAEAFGGQAGTSSMIRNYLGFPGGITGRELGRRGTLQAGRFGAELDMARAVEQLEPGSPHRLALSDGAVAAARAVVLTCGVTYRRLGVEPLEALVGAGVYYGAAASQARALEDAEVVVVGAGNSGGQAAVLLARYAAQVTLVARRPALDATMSAYLVREIAAHERIEVRTSTEVVDGGGDGRLEWLELADRASGRRDRVAAAGLFLLIGTETRTGWLPPAVERDDHGFVLTGTDVDAAVWPLDRSPYPLETSVPGVFAAGDVRAGGVKRVATAAGEGAMAVPMVHRWLAGP
jgi:thioredoxin reductase (NADPH)